MLPDYPFLLPHEPTEQFSQLESAWTQSLPGESFILQTLRQDLIHADWLRRRARAFFHQLQLDLHLTGLPMPYWDPFTQKQFHFLEKHASRTQQEFRKAFQLLHSFKPAPAKPASAPAAPPEPQRDTRPIYQQTVIVSVVDGKTITTDMDPSFMLSPQIQERSAGLWRLFTFQDAVIPPEYAYVMEHNGTHYGPAGHILISYRLADAIEICGRELAAQSQHLFDGKRWGYTHPATDPLR